MAKLERASNRRTASLTEKERAATGFAALLLESTDVQASNYAVARARLMPASAFDLRNLSIAAAALRPSEMAHTTSD